MKDKIFMILLGIIAVNLTIQTVKEVGFFSIAYAQDYVQKVAICSETGIACADLKFDRLVNDEFYYALSVSNIN